MAEIDRGAPGAPPHTWQGLPDVALIRVKAAKMLVFSKKECNDNLKEKLTKNEECKLLT